MANKATYSLKDILANFDMNAAKRQFVVLDGGEQKPADARITAYRDHERWAVVVEALAFFGASPGHRGVVTAMYKYGNCLTGKQGWENSDRVQVTSDAPAAPTFLPPYDLDVNPAVQSICIRGSIVAVDLSRDALRHKGIPMPKAGEIKYLRDGVLVTEAFPPLLEGQHLLWCLLPEYRELLLATEYEKRRRLPPTIAKFMQLEEWNHPLLMTKRLQPSDSETFQMLADAIVHDDPQRYRPTLAPNTHWKHWLGYDRV